MNEEIYVVGEMSAAEQTAIHPIGLLAVIILGLCVLLLPRRWAVIPFLAIACFVSSAQRIVVWGLDFDFLRVMVLFGIFRVVLYKEYIRFVWNPLDTAMVLWTISSIFLYVLNRGTFSAVINRLGFGFNAFGMYFLFRCLIRSWADVDRIILGSLCISIQIAVFFLLESRTGRNLFSVFGGVPAITVVREGRLRCQGAFSHAILAGCFWATFMPLFLAIWWKSSVNRFWSIIGLITSSIIVVCCASSTPVLSVLSILVGWLLFPLRRHMRTVCWCVLLTLIALHMVMEAPVWHLVSRVSSVGGSAGWHRFNLINQTIINFKDWWFCGCPGYTVASWGIWAGDITNQYVVEGISGGLLTLILFLTVIITAFGRVGKLWRLETAEKNKYRAMLSWALGVSLFAQCITFIGVSYFGQIYIVWYLILAIIGSMTVHKNTCLRKRGI